MRERFPRAYWLYDQSTISIDLKVSKNVKITEIITKILEIKEVEDILFFDRSEGVMSYKGFPDCERDEEVKEDE